jgi:hypothetical protein
MSATAAHREIRTLSVRVPETIYSEARKLAENRKISLNALVSETLSKAVEAAHDIEMYEAATLLGRDAEMSSVEFAFSAQSEIALSHE